MRVTLEKSILQVALCVFVGSVLPAAADERPFAGRVVMVNGGAYLQKRKVNVGDRLYTGDRIETGKTGSVKLLMTDKTILDIAPSTSFKVDEYQLKNTSDREVQLGIDFGRVRASVNRKLKEKGRFQIRTKSSVLSVRGTEFVVNAGLSGMKSQVLVIEGKVEVNALAGKAPPTFVTPGQLLSSSVSRSPNALGPPSNFESQVKSMAPNQVAAIASSSRVHDTTFVNAIVIQPSSEFKTASSHDSPSGKTTADILAPASVANLAPPEEVKIVSVPAMMPGVAAAGGLLPSSNSGVATTPDGNLSAAPPPSFVSPPGVTIRIH